MIHKPIAKRYVIYLRKSTDTDDKQIASIQTQNAAMIKFKEFGFNVVEILDERKSAFKPGRPQFELMMKLIDEGKVDGVLAYDETRISRNPRDEGVFVQAMRDGKIKHFQTHNTSYNSESNLLMLQIMMAVAHEDSHSKGSRVAAGMAMKASKGMYPGRILGYHHEHQNSHTGQQAGMIITKSNWSILRHLFEMALSGVHTKAEIHRKAIAFELGRTKKKKSPISYNAIVNMLKNEFYSGYYWWNNLEGIKTRYKGIHKTVITPEEFEQIQEIHFGQKKKVGHQEKKNRFDLADLFRCKKCNRSIVGEQKHQGRCKKCKCRFSCLHRDSCPKCGKGEHVRIGKRQVYYSCCGRKRGCSKVYTNEQSLIAQIESGFKDLGISEELNRLIKFLLSYKKIKLNDLKGQKESISNKLSELQKRSSRLIDLRSDGEISKDDFLLKKEEIQKRIFELEKELISLESSNGIWLYSITETLDILQLLTEGFIHQPFEVKKQILQGFGSNPNLNEGKLELSIPKHFFSLSQAEKKYLRAFGRVEALLIELELDKSSLFQKEDPTDPRISFWLAELRKVRGYKS